MKKLTATMLALAILCSVSACGGADDTSVTEDSKTILDEVGGIMDADDAVMAEMELEQRLTVAYEALEEAYESGDDALIAEIEAEIEALQEQFDRMMAEMPFEENEDTDDDDVIYYFDEDEWADDEWDDDWEEFTYDDMHDERLFGVEWYSVSDDYLTYHIKAYGYGDYDKRITYSVYDPRTDTSEYYGFLIGDDYVDSPDDPSVSVFRTAVYPEYDINTGESYAEEVWHMVIVDGGMELQRYTVGEHGYHGDFIDSMLFTNHRPG